MIGRIGLTLLTLTLSVASSVADEIYWYGSGSVKIGGEAKGFPLKGGERVQWCLCFVVEANDEKFPFGKRIPAQLSVAAGDRHWTFGNLEAESTRISVRDSQRRDLVNFAFGRGTGGVNFAGPGAGGIWTSTFRIHGSPEMVSAETGRALSHAFFDWNSSDFHPFIALGYGDETYLWITLLSLNEGAEGIAASTPAETSTSVGFAPAIRVRRETAGENAKRILLEYTVNNALYANGSGPVLETSTDLVHWQELEPNSYTLKIVEHENGSATHQYELLPNQQIGSPGHRFFRVRSQ